MFILLVFIWFLCIIFSYGLWKDSYFDSKKIKNVKPNFPFVGNLLNIVLRKKNMVMQVHDIYQKFPQDAYFGLHEFGNHSIVLRDLNLIRDIGVKYFDHFQDHRNYIDDKLDSLFGNFLITLKGSKWKTMRSMLSPGFTALKLKQTFYLILECGNQLNNYIDEITHELKENEYVEVEMNSILKRYTNDIIASTAFGLKVNTFKEPKNEIFKMGKSAADLGGFRFLKICIFSCLPKVMKMFNVSIYDENLKNFFRNLVKTVIDQREESGHSRADIIQLLMEGRHKINTYDGNEKMWTHDELTAQSMLFFIAGYDSTSHVLSFIVRELAINTKVQEKLRKEVDDFVKSGEKLSMDATFNMKYMDMVVSETLRLWPPVGMVDRVCKKYHTLPPPNEKSKLQYQTMINQCIWIPIYSIQRDAKHFPNPDKFDPERFSDENKSNIKPFSYMPFGVGPRTCIGYRYSLIVLKVALFSIIKQFELVAVEKTKLPVQVDEVPFVTQSKNGYWIGLKKRKFSEMKNRT